MIEYLPKTSEQLLTIIYSVGIGFALGLFYEFLRLFFYLLSGSDKKIHSFKRYNIFTFRPHRYILLFHCPL